MLIKLLDWFKGKSDLINENMKIRKGKFDIEQKFNDMLEDLNTITIKYTNLLENKSNSFDLYIKYQNQCLDLTNDKRELKKQVAELTEQNNHMANIILGQEKTILKFQQKFNKLEKKKTNA